MSAVMDTPQVAVADIKINGGTQPRCEINDALVSEYAEAMKSGEQFPPVVVFEDGLGYWLADGFHRTHAARRAGVEFIDAEIHQGTKRDAILYSVGANAAHGQRRTNADKRKAVMTLLEDEEWSQWSDREIARRCAVADRTVNRIREEITATMSQSEDAAPDLAPDKQSQIDEVQYQLSEGNITRDDANEQIAKIDPDWYKRASGERTYTTKHGTTATMNTSNIGRRESAQPDAGGNESEQPDETPKPESRGQGLRFAHEAIATLKRIPHNDGLREDAFDTVINWINANRSRS